MVATTFTSLQGGTDAVGMVAQQWRDHWKSCWAPLPPKKASACHGPLCFPFTFGSVSKPLSTKRLAPKRLANPSLLRIIYSQSLPQCIPMITQEKVCKVARLLLQSAKAQALAGSADILSMDWRHYELDISAAWSDDCLSSESLQLIPGPHFLAAGLMPRYLCQLRSEDGEDRMLLSHCVMAVAAQAKPAVQVMDRLRHGCQQRRLRPLEAPSGMTRWLASMLPLVKQPLLRVSWTWFSAVSQMKP